MAGMHGKFVWYELMTPDIDAASAFYQKVFGWRIETGKTAGMPYLHIAAGDYPVGGMMELPAELKAKGVPPNWSGYIAVDDIEAAAKKAVAAGGKLERPPEDIPNVGRFAVVADPAGAVFMLFKGNQRQDMPPRPAMGTPGLVEWNELYGGEVEASFAFYAGLFGWTKNQAMDMGPMGSYQTFDIDGAWSGGMMKTPPEMPASAWVYYVAVEDIDAAQKRAVDGGAHVVMGPMEVPGGQWIVQALDPQKAFFAMVGPRKT